MSFGITELLVILAIVVLLFGTGKLKSMGSDLGSAIKGFRSAISNEDKEKDNPKLKADDPEVKNVTPEQTREKAEAHKD